MLAIAPSHPWPTDEPPAVDLPTGTAGFPRAAGRQGLPPPPPDFSTLRYPDHRHSMYSSTRRPLRSSPLAGPALQLDAGSIPEVVVEEKNPRPSRILSTPDLASLLKPPPPLRHSRPKTAESAIQGFSHVSSSSPGPLKRPVSLFGGLTKSCGSAEMVPLVSSSLRPTTLNSSSTSSLTLGHPPSMGDCLGGNKPSPTPFVVRRPKTAHGYPNIPQSISGSNLPSSEHIPQIHSRDSMDKSWFTTNTYETTPKFSRLGLAGSNVILPVSAKEHKRLSHQTSKSSVGTSTGTITRVIRTDSSASSSSPSSPDISPTTSQQQQQQDTLNVTTPSLTTSWSSSSSSSDSERDVGSIPSPPPLPPSSSSSSPPRRTSSTSNITITAVTTTNITTIAEGDESEQQIRHQVQDNKSHQRSITTPIIPSSNQNKKKNPLKRFKNFKLLRSIKSLNAIHFSSINDEKSKVDDGGEIKVVGLGIFEEQNPNLSMEEEEEEEEDSNENSSSSKATMLSVFAVTSEKKKNKKTGSSFGMKRLWNSMMNW